MPRPPRIDYPGARHHVMNRGSRKESIYFGDEDCSSFCDILSDVVERFGIIIHGYALMPNHYHLMVESVKGNLSDAMNLLGSRYTQMVNRQQGFDGHIFRGRYHNRVVTDPNHWRHLLIYLHLNPVKARFVPRVDQWRWTSHAYYRGKKPMPVWLTTEELIEQFGGVEGYRKYLTEIRQGRRKQPDEFEKILFGRQRSTDKPLIKLESSGRISPEKAIQGVLEVSGRKRSEIYREVRGRGGNVVRTVTAWWLAVGSGCSNRQVAEILNMSKVSVSRALTRVRRESHGGPDSEIYKWVLELKERK